MDEEQPRKTSFLASFVLNGAFILMGTMSTLSGKMMYQTMAPTGEDDQTQLFKKPWFQVWGMFLAMAMVGPILFMMRISQRLQQNGKPLKPLVVGQPMWKVALLVLMPAGCDLIATMLQNVALLFTNVSIWQMLRGSTPVFTAIVRYFYLKKRTRSHEMWGVGFVMLGLCVVGMASFVTPSATGSDDTTNIPMALKALGIGLVLLAQMTQSMQGVLEEELLHDVESNALLIVALEGFWGFLITSFIFMPLAQFLPGKDGEGVHENIWPSELYSLMNSKALQIVVFVYVFVICLYNVSGMWITEVTDATTKNVMDAGRTLSVWVATLLLAVIYPRYGEPIGWFNFVELAGFLLLMLGMFVYYDTVKLPWIRKVGPGELATAFMSPMAAPGAPHSPGPQPMMSPAGVRTAEYFQNSHHADDGDDDRYARLEGEIMYQEERC